MRLCGELKSVILSKKRCKEKEFKDLRVASYEMRVTRCGLLDAILIRHCNVRQHDVYCFHGQSQFYKGEKNTKGTTCPYLKKPSTLGNASRNAWYERSKKNPWIS